MKLNGTFLFTTAKLVHTVRCYDLQHEWCPSSRQCSFNHFSQVFPGILVLFQVQPNQIWCWLASCELVWPNARRTCIFIIYQNFSTTEGIRYHEMRRIPFLRQLIRFSFRLLYVCHTVYRLKIRNFKSTVNELLRNDTYVVYFLISCSLVDNDSFQHLVNNLRSFQFSSLLIALLYKFMLIQHSDYYIAGIFLYSIYQLAAVILKIINFSRFICLNKIVDYKTLQKGILNY